MKNSAKANIHGNIGSLSSRRPALLGPSAADTVMGQNKTKRLDEKSINLVNLKDSSTYKVC